MLVLVLVLALEWGIARAFRGSLYRDLEFGQSTRVEWDFLWPPIWGTAIWPVYPGRMGFFVVPYLGNWDLASLPA